MTAAAARWSLVVVVGAAVALTVAAVVALPSSRAVATATPSSSSLDCGTVTSLLAGCKAFVRRGVVVAGAGAPPTPGAACCEGVAELYAVASDSADNWRSVCRCMAGLVRRYASNASAIALLPVLCAVLPPAGDGDTLTYCTA